VEGIITQKPPKNEIETMFDFENYDNIKKEHTQLDLYEMKFSSVTNQ